MSSLRTLLYRYGLIMLGLLAFSLVGRPTARGASNGYVQTNLVSDIPGLALNTDPDLLNPWGVAFNGDHTVLWVNDNGTGLSTLFDGTGTKLGLIVTIPPPTGAAGPATPTGIVFNGTPGIFQVASGGVSGTSFFIFATEDGTISGWAPSVDFTHAILAVDHSAAGAVYKGLAMANTASGPALYATNFHDRRVEVFDSA